MFSFRGFLVGVFFLFFLEILPFRCLLCFLCGLLPFIPSFLGVITAVDAFCFFFLEGFMVSRCVSGLRFGASAVLCALFRLLLSVF